MPYSGSFISLLVGFGLFVNIERSMVDGHAKMIEPPMRSSMWRFGFDTPINYNDNELFCGGIQRFLENGGRCGTCGDPYDDPHPAHEAGGRFATGTIVRYYPARVGKIPVTIDVTAHHKGFFEFRLCAHNDVNTRVTQDCLDQTVLIIEEGEHMGHPNRFFPSDNGLWNVTLKIPPEITCTQCVLQMRYKAGNSWGTDLSEADKGPCLGCGPQEEFRNCADISIGYPEPPSTTMATRVDYRKTTSQEDQSAGQARNNDQRHQNETPGATYTGKNKKTIDRSSTQENVDNLKTNYNLIYDAGRVQFKKLIKTGDHNDFNFRVRRVEETLSLLDDTERVLEALGAHLDKNPETNQMSGSEYVKLYAGLVWTKRKIRHLENLIAKVSSKLSLIRHASKPIKKSKTDTEVHLSEYTDKASDRNHKSVSSVAEDERRTNISDPNAARYVNTVAELKITDAEQPIYRKAVAVSATDVTSNDAKKGNTNRVGITEQVTKVPDQVQNKPRHLVAKFPALNAWRLTTLNPEQSVQLTSQTARSTTSGSAQVLAPNSMPWSPDSTVLSESEANKPMKSIRSNSRRSKTMKVKNAPDISKVEKSGLKRTHSNEILRETQNRVTIQGKMVRRQTSKHTASDVLVTKGPEKGDKVKTHQPIMEHIEMIPSLGVLGLEGASARQKEKITATVPSTRSPSIHLKTDTKATNRSGPIKLNKKTEALAKKLRELRKVGGPMSKWIIAELKNRILHHQYLRAQDQTRSGSVVKGNLIK